MTRLTLLLFSLLVSFLSSVASATAQDAVVQDAVAQDAIALSFTPPAPVAVVSPVAADPVPKPDVLSFDPPANDRLATVAGADPEAAAHPANLDIEATQLFAGGSDSVVARTIGHAEGTRTVEGSRTSAYYGHVDPGNGAWNRGTFSYQGGGAELSPEQADDRQLATLQHHYAQTVVPKAQRLGLELSMPEKLNALDLANQAPLAVTAPGGFVERLAEAKQQKQLQGEAATLEARVWSFWDEGKGGWDAPGLRAGAGNPQEGIRRDQARRVQAIERALRAYQPSVEQGERLARPPQSGANAIISRSPQ